MIGSFWLKETLLNVKWELSFCMGRGSTCVSLRTLPSLYENSRSDQGSRARLYPPLQYESSASSLSLHSGAPSFQNFPFDVLSHIFMLSIPPERRLSIGTAHTVSLIQSSVNCLSAILSPAKIPGSTLLR